MLAKFLVVLAALTQLLSARDSDDYRPVCNCQALKTCKDTFKQQKAACLQDASCLEVLRNQGLTNGAAIARCFTDAVAEKAAMKDCIETRLGSTVGCVDGPQAATSPFNVFFNRNTRQPRVKRDHHMDGKSAKKRLMMQVFSGELAPYHQCVMQCCGIMTDDDNEEDFDDAFDDEEDSFRRRFGVMRSGDDDAAEEMMEGMKKMKNTCFDELQCRVRLTREERHRKWRASTECKQQSGNQDGSQVKLCQCLKNAGANVNCT